jgi:hypothetical protein
VPHRSASALLVFVFLLVSLSVLLQYVPLALQEGVKALHWLLNRLTPVFTPAQLCTAVPVHPDILLSGDGSSYSVVH